MKEPFLVPVSSKWVKATFRGHLQLRRLIQRDVISCNELFCRACTLGHAVGSSTSSAPPGHGTAATWHAPRSLQLCSAKPYVGSSSW